MTDFVALPSTGGLIKLRGRISAYRRTHGRASFVFTEDDQTAMGVIAVAAAAAGLGGQAMGTAANASAMDEEADYVEFVLEGQPIKGWVWRSPFQEGDEVEVAAEWQKDHYEVFGIARPVDHTIALYPHCSRGRLRHFKNAVKWWVIVAGVCEMAYLFVLHSMLMSHGESLQNLDEAGVLKFAVAGPPAFFALMIFSLSRKWLPFVRLAERVFTVLGWSDPGNVDLVKSSKAQRTDRDSSEYGTFYFRY